MMYATCGLEAGVQMILTNAVQQMRLRNVVEAAIQLMSKCLGWLGSAELERKSPIMILLCQGLAREPLAPPLPLLWGFP